MSEAPRGTGRAVASLAGADRLPAGQSGAAFVRYVGGREAAKRALSGMTGPPGARSNYRSDEAYQEARRTWKRAARRVERWTTETGSERRGGTVDAITPAQRRRAQSINRERKRETIRREGILARLSGTITIDGRRGRDERTRTIGQHGGGIAIGPDEAAAILDALAAGDREEAEELLWLAFLDAIPLPAEYTSVKGARWEIRAA